MLFKGGKSEMGLRLIFLFLFPYFTAINVKSMM